MVVGECCLPSIPKKQSHEQDFVASDDKDNTVHTVQNQAHLARMQLKSLSQPHFSWQKSGRRSWIMMWSQSNTMDLDGHNLVCNSLDDTLLLWNDADFPYHSGADLGMAGWLYPAAVYIIMIIALDLQAKGN